MTDLAEKPKTRSIELRHVFHVPAERLFDAWTDPSLVVQWFGPAGFTTPEAKIDLRVGGGYRFRMHPPQGEPLVHWGEYKVIDRPRTLSFTWMLENQGCEGSKDVMCETLVTLQFIEMGDKTELIVTHDGLPTEQSREGHAFGWNSSLTCLQEMVG